MSRKTVTKSGPDSFKHEFDVGECLFHKDARVSCVVTEIEMKHDKVIYTCENLSDEPEFGCEYFTAEEDELTR